MFKNANFLNIFVTVWNTICIFLLIKLSNKVFLNYSLYTSVYEEINVLTQLKFILLSWVQIFMKLKYFFSRTQISSTVM